jgi:hypothetical protein
MFDCQRFQFLTPSRVMFGGGGPKDVMVLVIKQRVCNTNANIE